MISEKDLQAERKQKATYSPDTIYVQGAVLKDKIFARVKKIEAVHAGLLHEIAELLRQGAGDGDPAEVAAVVLVALQDNYSLGGHALSIRSFIERAAQLQAEQRDLVRFGKNLMLGAPYELTWEEADRFGL